MLRTCSARVSILKITHRYACILMLAQEMTNTLEILKWPENAVKYVCGKVCD